jgi:hypothetical protein
MALIDDIRIFEAWLKSGDVFDLGDGCQFLIALSELTEPLTDQPEADRSFDRHAILSQWLSKEKIATDRDRPRKAFKAAMDYLEQGTARYRDHVLVNGGDHMLRVCTNQGGGAGRRTTHFLRRVAITSGNAIIPVSPVPSDQPSYLEPSMDRSHSHWIAYRAIPREQILLSRRGRLYFGRDDVRAGTIRQNIMVAALVIDLGVVVVSGVCTILLLELSNGPVTSKQLGAVLSTIALAALLYLFTIRPFAKLAEHRIIIMDDTWLKSDETPAVLEKLQDPAMPGRSMMRVSRYESTCSICGSTVRLRNGGTAWPDRIVGACVNSSLEHVYSFDRFSLVGRPLRSEMITPAVIPD